MCVIHGNLKSIKRSKRGNYLHLPEHSFPHSSMNHNKLGTMPNGHSVFFKLGLHLQSIYMTMVDGVVS